MDLSCAFSLAPDAAVLEKAEEQGAGVSIHLAVKCELRPVPFYPG